jgi:hypothetical protein
LTSAAAARAEDPYRSGLMKYRERFPAWTGTSGPVKLTARMLVAADGTTELVATTGDLDSTTVAPGNLQGLLITAVNSQNRLVYSKIFINSSGNGLFRKTLTGLAPGQQFFIQGIVLSKANGRLRLDYVNVRITVQRRPDLNVHDLNVPAKVPINTPVHITAAVSELNGQVGARTDCVLYVNGVEEDRAPSVWVDSGDTVTCAFSHTFTSEAVSSIKVAAESPVPSEWDPSNNETESTVTSLSPLYDAFGARAIIYDLSRIGVREYGRYYNSSANVGQDFLFETFEDTVGDFFDYAGFKINAPGTPQTMVIAATDGVKTWQVEHPLTVQATATGCSAFEWGEHDGRRYYVYAQGCNGTIYTQAGSNAGAVTYTSRNFTQNFRVVNGTIVHDAPADFVENRTEVLFANMFTGSSWAVDVAVWVDGFPYHSVAAFDVTAPFDIGEQTTTCGSTPLLVVYCTDTGWRRRGRSGAFTQELEVPPPPTPSGAGG